MRGYSGADLSAEGMMGKCTEESLLGGGLCRIGEGGFVGREVCVGRLPAPPITMVSAMLSLQHTLSATFMSRAHAVLVNTGHS